MDSGSPLSGRLARRRALQLLATGAAALAGLRIVSPVAQAKSSPGSAVSDGSAGNRPVRVLYSPDYALAAHSFETTRKARWIADSLTEDPLPGVELVAPVPVTEAEVTEVHDPTYVTAVRTGEPRALAESQGFTWDPGLWPMVLASNGGAVVAALTALKEGGVSGSLSSGLHHASRARGKGFCTFNGLALAARAVVAAGASRVLILDLVAHCGGGTHSILGSDPAVWHVDVAVSGFDSYEPTPGNTLDLVRAADDYLPTITARLEELPSRVGSFDVCLYNAGMDPHEDCPTGGLAGITREVIEQREQLVFEWCRQQDIPIAFVLAGGYTGPKLDRRGLVDLHRLTLAVAAA